MWTQPQRRYATSHINTPGRAGGRSLSMKRTKVTLFTMILYNSANNISKPIPSKSFVTFNLFHCLREKVTVSSIVLSPQFCEVYFISHAVTKPL